MSLLWNTGIRSIGRKFVFTLWTVHLFTCFILLFVQFYNSILSQVHPDICSNLSHVPSCHLFHPVICSIPSNVPSGFMFYPVICSIQSSVPSCRLCSSLISVSSCHQLILSFVPSCYLFNQIFLFRQSINSIISSVPFYHLINPVIYSKLSPVLLPAPPLLPASFCHLCPPSTFSIMSIFLPCHLFHPVLHLITSPISLSSPLCEYVYCS